MNLNDLYVKMYFIEIIEKCDNKNLLIIIYHLLKFFLELIYLTAYQHNFYKAFFRLIFIHIHNFDYQEVLTLFLFLVRVSVLYLIRCVWNWV